LSQAPVAQDPLATAPLTAIREVGDVRIAMLLEARLAGAGWTQPPAI
jgi:hypothetical protein